MGTSVDQIWSQLPPIGLPGLDSWSPLTLTWYWVPSLTFSNMYRLNTRAGVLPRSASSHFNIHMLSLQVCMKMVITDNIAPQVAIRKLHTDTYLDANCTKYFNDGEELRKCIDSIPVKTDTVISTALAAILKFKHFCINGTFLRYSARIWHCI